MDSDPLVNNSEKIRLYRESGQNLHGGSDEQKVKMITTVTLSAKSNDDSIEATRVKQQESQVSFFFVFTQY